MLRKIINNKVFLLGLSFSLLFSFSVVYADNPTTPINPNDNILDPGSPSTAWGGCGPTDSNCYVATPWKNTGSDIYFTGGNVGIGSTSPGSLLSLQGTFGSTIPLLTVASSSGATYLTVNSAGHVGIMTAASATADLNIQNTITPSADTASFYGINQSLTFNPSVDITSHAEFGAYFSLNVPSSSTKNFDWLLGSLSSMTYAASGTANQIIGADGEAFNNGIGTVTVANGVEGFVANTATGTITDAAVFSTEAANWGNTGIGTITNLQGVRIHSAVNSGGGTVTNLYGVKVDDQTAGTNNWNIYSGLATSSFSSSANWTLYSKNAFGAIDGTAVGVLSQANTAASIDGLDATAISSHTTGNIPTLVGVSAIAYNEGAGTVSNSYGTWSGAEMLSGSGAVTKASGLYGTVTQRSGAGIDTTMNAIEGLVVKQAANITTNAVGLQIAAPIMSTGTITNLYGINVADQTVGTNNYAISTNETAGANNYAIYNAGTAKSYFGGIIKIGGTALRGTTEGTNHLDIFDGTAPVGTLANGISLYSTAGELRVMDAAGNATLLSPHDLDTNYWVFDSVNEVKGTSLLIDMEEMMKQLNSTMGWDYVHETLNGVTLHDSTPLVLPDTFLSAITSKITGWLSDAGNGVGDFFANRVRTKEICVAKSDGTEFCANGDELEAMAENTTPPSSSTPTQPPPTVGGGEAMPEAGEGGGNSATDSISTDSTSSPQATTQTDSTTSDITSAPAPDNNPPSDTPTPTP